MAIKTKYFKTRSDGVILDFTYSDLGVMIERDGVRYSEAIDPRELGRVYTETDEPCDEISAEEALEIITGGAV